MKLEKTKVLLTLLKEKSTTGVRGDMRYARNVDIIREYRAAIFALVAKKNSYAKREDNNLLVLFFNDERLFVL